MESIQFVKEPHQLFMLYGTGPAAPEYCGYVGNVIKRQHAENIVQAVNTYDERQQLLEALQTVLASLPRDLATVPEILPKLRPGLYLELKNLQKQVNAAVLQHHEWLEQQS